MVEVVEPPDGETLAVQYLAALLADQPGFEAVEVSGSLAAEDPDFEPPAEAVVVRGTGGAPRDVLVTDAQITLTAWAATPGAEVRAGEIARRCAALMVAAERLGFMAGTACTRVQVFSVPYNDPDPTTGRARYSATYGVSLRGHVVRV
ncbi:head-to-tail-connector protein [Arthrobacter phage Abidatro]|uniref:Tail terminator n=1 Tax=Arthrobacter phage Abidatro TaxID=2015853 RepID=A0A222ZFW9_9CAUD|nr:head-to-tail-connector protein [Arthrobacter phage Abidatro]ASR83182.1 tail terminator [Arthrobacter phage Abidatro]